MAILFMDGMDSVANDGDFDDKWDLVNAGTISAQTTGGRFGGGAAKITDNVNTLTKFFPEIGTTATTDEFFFAAAVKVDTGYDNEDIMLIGGPKGTNIWIRMTSSGFIEVRTGSTGFTLLGTTSDNLIVDQWHWLEIRLVVDNSAGIVEVRIDENVSLSLTSQDTKHSGDLGFSWIKLRGLDAASTSFFWDDIIVMSSNGDAPTDFIGDHRIYTLRPDGAGDSSDSTPSGAATRHEAVDEASSDGDTTHVAMAAALDEDLYTCDNMPETVDTITAVGISVLCRADGTTHRQLKTKTKHSTTEGNGSTEVVQLGSAYNSIQGFFPLNPSTSLAWTSGEVDAMQIGQEIVA